MKDMKGGREEKERYVGKRVREFGGKVAMKSPKAKTTVGKRSVEEDSL